VLLLLGNLNFFYGRGRGLGCLKRAMVYDGGFVLELQAAFHFRRRLDMSYEESHNSIFSTERSFSRERQGFKLHVKF
jgi:hypothetical protein